MGINIKRLSIIIGAILLTAVLVGTLVWSRLNSSIVEQDKQIDLLEGQVDKLSTQITQKIAEKKAAELAVEEVAKSSTTKNQTSAPIAADESGAATEPSSDSGSAPTPAPEPEGPAVLFYFYDPHCGACMIETPIVQQVEAGGVPVSYMDVDAHPSYISQYGIKFVPTFIVNGHKQVAVFTKEELIGFYNTYK